VQGAQVGGAGWGGWACAGGAGQGCAPLAAPWQRRLLPSCPPGCWHLKHTSPPRSRAAWLPSALAPPAAGALPSHAKRAEPAGAAATHAGLCAGGHLAGAQQHTCALDTLEIRSRGAAPPRSPEPASSRHASPPPARTCLRLAALAAAVGWGHLGAAAASLGPASHAVRPLKEAALLLLQAGTSRRRSWQTQGQPGHWWRG
jgi:hypothetical protein